MLTSLSAGMIGFALVTYTLTNPSNAAFLPCIYGDASSSGNSGSSTTTGMHATTSTTTSSIQGVYRLVPTTELDSQSTVEYRNIPNKHTRRTVLLLYAMYYYYTIIYCTIYYTINYYILSKQYTITIFY